MCPFCLLTAVAVASGAITAGGFGVALIGKTQGKHGMHSDAGEPGSKPQEKSSHPSI
jgi:hypothetical protein